MIGRRLRSTRGRVAITTLLTFSVVGLVVFAVLDRSGVIERLQDFRENELIDREEARLADELAATGTATARSGQVRTIIVPPGSVAGFDPFETEVEAEVVPSTVDVSPAGLDDALFDSTVVYFPSLSQRGGWRVFRGADGNPRPVDAEGSVALLAVTDDAVIGPLSVRESLLAAVPIGSATLAAMFAVVAGSGLRPVRRMSRQAAAIEIGELDRRLPEPGTGDELDELAATLNGMLDRIGHGVATERRFVADAAHELRSPIAASSALLEVALATDEPDWESTAGRVLDEQRRLAAVVDDLVLLARLDEAGRGPQQSERVMLDDLVATETSRPFRPAIEVVELEPVAIDGDHRSLQRVVRNLLANADRHAEARIEVRLVATGSEGVLHVDDDGPGVPAGSRSVVFDRFARLDDARSRDDGGSGIGLAIVKEVVEAHNGTVAVGDSPLGGARFTVNLPTASASS